MAIADVQTYQLVIDTRDLANTFSWLSASSNQEQTTLEIRAHFTIGGKAHVSEALKKRFDTVFNLRRHEGDICKNGFYSFPLAFARPSFMSKLYDLANNVLNPDTESFRCNDVAHPFGGKFLTHDTHNDGDAIDLRYFDSAGATQDERDGGKGKLKADWVDGLFTYYKSIEDDYFSSGEAIAAKDLSLGILCSDTGLSEDCQKISGPVGSTYALDDILETCARLTVSGQVEWSELNDKCRAFPGADAYKLSDYIESHELAFDKLKKTNSGTKPVVGIGERVRETSVEIGWQSNLFKGRVSKRTSDQSEFYPLFKFTGESTISGAWDPVDRSLYGLSVKHDDHFHLRLEK